MQNLNETLIAALSAWFSLVGCGAGEAPTAPPPDIAAVTIEEVNDEHTIATLTDGTIELRLEATVAESGTTELSVTRRDGSNFYSVVMDAEHEPIRKVYQAVAVSREDYERGLSPEMEQAMDDLRATDEAYLLATFHHQVDMETPHRSLAELIGLASTMESLILGPVPEGARNICIPGTVCCGDSCDCHGHRNPTCENGGCCNGGGRGGCPWWTGAACLACELHDVCVHFTRTHNASGNCVI